MIAPDGAVVTVNGVAEIRKDKENAIDKWTQMSFTSSATQQQNSSSEDENFDEQSDTSSDEEKAPVITKPKAKVNTNNNNKNNINNNNNSSSSSPSLSAASYYDFISGGDSLKFSSKIGDECHGLIHRCCMNPSSPSSSSSSSFPSVVEYASAIKLLSLQATAPLKSLGKLLLQLKQLSHDNLIPIQKICLINDKEGLGNTVELTGTLPTLGVIMPYIKYNVSSLLHVHDRAITSNLRLQLLFAVANGLAYLHEQDMPGLPNVKLFHGDLHAENILIQLSPLKIQITDYYYSAFNHKGGCFASRQSKSATRHFYKESNLTKGHHKDQFSFGIIALQLFSGTVPFSDRSKLDHSRLVNNPAYVIPIPSCVPPELHDILSKCLSRDVKRCSASFHDIIKVIAPLISQLDASLDFEQMIENEKQVVSGSTLALYSHLDPLIKRFLDLLARKRFTESAKVADAYANAVSTDATRINIGTCMKLMYRFALNSNDDLQTLGEQLLNNSPNLNDSQKFSSDNNTILATLIICLRYDELNHLISKSKLKSRYDYALQFLHDIDVIIIPLWLVTQVEDIAQRSKPPNKHFHDSDDEDGDDDQPQCDANGCALPDNKTSAAIKHTKVHKDPIVREWLTIHKHYKTKCKAIFKLLKRFVGLEDVKNKMIKLYTQSHIGKLQSLEASRIGVHAIFDGNPGTLFFFFFCLLFLFFCTHFQICFDVCVCVCIFLFVF